MACIDDVQIRVLPDGATTTCVDPFLCDKVTIIAKDQPRPREYQVKIAREARDARAVRARGALRAEPLREVHEVRVDLVLQQRGAGGGAAPGDVAFLDSSLCNKPIASSGGTWLRSDFTGFKTGCSFSVRQRVVLPLQTLSNLLAALREGKYDASSIRVITRLTNERSGQTLWTDTFDYVVTDGTDTDTGTVTVQAYRRVRWGNAMPVTPSVTAVCTVAWAVSNTTFTEGSSRLAAVNTSIPSRAGIRRSVKIKPGRSRWMMSSARTELDSVKHSYGTRLKMRRQLSNASCSSSTIRIVGCISGNCGGSQAKRKNKSRVHGRALL